MSPAHDDLLLLLAIIGGILVVATAIGMAMQWRFSRDRTNVTVENLNARIRAWWVMVILLGIAFWAGRPGIMILFIIVSFAALREFVTLARTAQADHMALAGAFFIVLPFNYWLVWIDWYQFFAIFIPVYAFLLMPIVAVVRGETDNFLDRITEAQWAVMISVYCVSHLPSLLALRIPGYEGREMLLIAFLIVVVQFSDVMQYVWGKLFGRHKVAPSLSPSKTWEGLIGGVLSAAAAGAALWWITPFSVVEAGALALVAALMGFFGGLVMSAIKRDRGVKDWGHLIAGHGGIIDRIDSLVFSAPIFFHLVRFWWSVA